MATQSWNRVLPFCWGGGRSHNNRSNNCNLEISDPRCEINRLLIL
ncbi:hypothetical protein [Leptolyngbya sp. FACHB-16]|nr:hypothetical protein [Leptolyngbya sp. FACHB-16]